MAFSELAYVVQIERSPHNSLEQAFCAGDTGLPHGKLL
jgi:hypothetical protein